MPGAKKYRKEQFEVPRHSVDTRLHGSAWTPITPTVPFAPQASNEARARCKTGRMLAVAGCARGGRPRTGNRWFQRWARRLSPLPLPRVGARRARAQGSCNAADEAKLKFIRDQLDREFCFTKEIQLDASLAGALDWTLARTPAEVVSEREEILQRIERAAAHFRASGAAAA